MEKIIKILECIAHNDCEECKYCPFNTFYRGHREEAIKDVIEFIKDLRVSAMEEFAEKLAEKFGTPDIFMPHNNIVCEEMALYETIEVLKEQK